MKKIIVSLFLLCQCGQAALAQTEAQQAAWKKMNASKASTVAWFKDAKFGMFIHWGLYAIPGGIWKGKKMEEMGRGPHIAEWVQYVAQIPRGEYAQLAQEFNPVKYDANAIVELAKQAGMKYIVITSKHHDGFALYKSEVSKFNMVDATPFKRDVIKELYEACKKQGLAFGLYYSHNIDWADGSDAQFAETKAADPALDLKFASFGANLWDPSPNTYQEYLDKKAIPQVKEIMTKFPGLKMLWYDMPRIIKPEQSFRFYETVYQIQPQVIITDRVGNQLGDYAIPGDNKIPENPDSITKPWEAIGTLNNSWGYKSYDDDWKSPKELLYWLVEIVSKGGNYMLNIGPKADGSVPEPAITNLKKVGEWLKINGEAIYGTVRWQLNHEGPTNIVINSTEQRQRAGFKATFTPQDFWFTKKKNTVYAIALEFPDGNVATIQSLHTGIGAIHKVELLGKGTVPFKQTAKGLSVTLPADFKPANGYVIKSTLK